ncbi:MAG TPA: hypothetical protein HA254_05255 [Candidatus Diapherotrites archaeon]|uniref:Bacterial EndoU nuclease domain-containing protein n=1 Tax=Candidatus Iainarchaeum sp. TaxID=3101447 RepID=A0A7J4J0Z0_9ARCH|nr:hypothetical protein [Candidatus Diapherotrites archaeon]
MSKLFLKLATIVFIAGFVSAYENQGVVYNLKDYREEIGTQHPFNTFSGYGERLDKATIWPVNDYVTAVANFVKSRCPIEYCKHVLIVGDDFVIPMGRENFIIGESQNITAQTLFFDRAYAPNTRKTMADTEQLFGKYRKIAFVVPETTNEKLREAINYLKTTLKNKYGVQDSDIEEYRSSEISCRYYPMHPLEGKTIVLIGTKSTNNLFSCVNSLAEKEDAFTIQTSPWSIGGYQNIMIINSQYPEIVNISAYLIEKDIIRKRDFTEIEYFNDQIRTCDTFSWLPFVGDLGEFCSVGVGCFVSGSKELIELEDNGATFWCSWQGAAVLIAPSYIGKGIKVGSKLLRPAYVKYGSRFVDELIEKITQKNSPSLGASKAKEIAEKTMEITGKSQKNWTKEEAEGLSEILALKGSDYYDNTLMSIGEDSARNFSKGVKRGAINPINIEPTKFKEIDEAYKRIGIDDALEITNVTKQSDQLEMLIKNETHGGTKIGDKTINGVTRMTKGEIPPNEDGWGWIKIKLKHVLGQPVNGKTGTTFKQVYGEGTEISEDTVKRWVDENIQNPKKIISNENDRFEYWYKPISGKPPMVTIIDNSDKFFKGKIVTSYPEPDPARWPDGLI